MKIYKLNTKMELYIKEWFNKENPKFDGLDLYIKNIKILKDEYKENKEYKILCHGTKPINLDSIIKNGFQKDYIHSNMNGLLGNGFYFSDMLEQSIYYTFPSGYNDSSDLKEKNRTEMTLLIVGINLKNCLEIKSFKTNKDSLYDTHFMVYKQGNKSGYEYCVFNEKNIKILALLKLDLVEVCKLTKDNKR